MGSEGWVGYPKSGVGQSSRLAPEGRGCSVGVATRAGGVEGQDGDPKQGWGCRTGVQTGAARGGVGV